MDWFIATQQLNNELLLFLIKFGKGTVFTDTVVLDGVKMEQTPWWHCWLWCRIDICMDSVSFLTSQRDGHCWLILITAWVSIEGGNWRRFSSFSAVQRRAMKCKLFLEDTGQNHQQHLLKIKIRKSPSFLESATATLGITSLFSSPSVFQRPRPKINRWDLKLGRALVWCIGPH